MNVPFDFMSNPQKQFNRQIFLKTYVENKPSKIYTQVTENLLVIVLHGKKHLIYRDYETTVKEGEFALFRKGNYIMNQILSDEKYESLLIFLGDEMLKSISRPSLSSSKEEIPFFKGNTIPYMANEVNSIQQLMVDYDQYEEIIHLKIMELLIYIQKTDQTGAFENFLHSLSMECDFRQNILQNYTYLQNIQEMADAVHMSVSSYKRKFQKTFGCTPHFWANEQKLSKAALLLDTSNYSITDICFICGFSSLSTFHAQFRKKYGISPGIYRKNR